MQTFFPYPDFAQSARVLDNKRLGKQRLEAKQILETNLLKIAEKVFYCLECDSFFPSVDDMHKPIGYKLKTYSGSEIKIAWENHPAVLMWRGYELALAYYGLVICNEWISRGFKDSQKSFFDDYIENNNPFNLKDNIKYPDWLGNPKLHLSHQSNLLRKDWDYYIKYFGENIQDPTLPYYWPVKK